MVDKLSYKKSKEIKTMKTAIFRDSKGMVLVIQPIKNIKESRQEILQTFADYPNAYNVLIGHSVKTASQIFLSLTEMYHLF